LHRLVSALFLQQEYYLNRQKAVQQLSFFLSIVP